MLYAIMNKENLLGLFSDLKKCKLTIQGLVTNKLLKETDLTIISYHENTITKTTTPNIFLEQSSDDEFEQMTSENTSEASSESDNESSEDTTEKRKKREKKYNRMKKLEYNITLLKQKKERIHESKNVYKVDLDLYKKFKKIKNDTPDFEIPPIFTEKYLVMEELDNKNELNWENFNECYEKKPLNNSYNMLFTGHARNRDLLDISASESGEEDNSVTNSMDNHIEITN